uniref:N-acetyltransferase domain-containing protein n=1 Tax=Chromera velia CCMP2878 TaxID=1169474 RepID=A0A0G4FA95_9ALVE|eukprot:Cvel_15863.t1-p1 / transcript=Cvel_15863.t1 / gene=Cvel_15863 / organism=Chromera_velia_CCMP2878 / gene_product=Uncharacterized N-acetyltransferase YjhQ, putative / transcript_product=Uncharacterized N-acetyltransferase YjhQ, putative / location=Cvel_scaffold1196:17627-18151(+) / protein_length=175 / sequence_SO=supercontig / SO=protein_coding / is_pseudo=false
MTGQVQIRPGSPSDIAALESLYPRVFPEEDLLPLVQKLLSEKDPVISLVATVKGATVGHVIFTMCGIEGGPSKIALLGPLGVDPEMQRQGIGTMLVRTGLDQMSASGVVQVNVLGDPSYYGRFGFKPDISVQPPFTLPEDWATAWQSLQTNPDRSPVSGKLQVPEPWQDIKLWAP